MKDKTWEKAELIKGASDFNTDLTKSSSTMWGAPEQRPLVRGAPCWAEMAGSSSPLYSVIAWGLLRKRLTLAWSLDRSQRCCSWRLSANSTLHRRIGSSFLKLCPSRTVVGRPASGLAVSKEVNFEVTNLFLPRSASAFTEEVRTIERLGSIQKLSFVFRQTFFPTHRLFSLY